jgi:hypothetical protein
MMLSKANLASDLNPQKAEIVYDFVLTPTMINYRLIYLFFLLNEVKANTINITTTTIMAVFPSSEDKLLLPPPPKCNDAIKLMNIISTIKF